jgi:hypothetical protein
MLVASHCTVRARSLPRHGREEIEGGRDAASERLRRHVDAVAREASACRSMGRCSRNLSQTASTMSVSPSLPLSTICGGGEAETGTRGRWPAVRRGRGHQVLESRARREVLVAEKKKARDLKGRDRLRAEVPPIDGLIERWVDAGRNVGSMVGTNIKLLDAHGAPILREVVSEMLAHGTHDRGTMAILCEQKRKRRDGSAPLSHARPCRSDLLAFGAYRHPVFVTGDRRPRR